MKRFLLIILAAFLSAVAAPTAHAGAPETNGARWASAKIDPKRSIELDKAVALYQRLAARYQRVEKMRPNGVPAPVVFCLHLRERDNSFLHHAHEGSPLTHRTRDVPKGRLPAPAQPPFTWEQSAEDAYYVCDRLDRKDWRTANGALTAIESFNGMGYAKKGLASPYDWGATNKYLRGKYVSDGRFDPLAVDRQLGCAAILLRMKERGITLPF